MRAPLIFLALFLCHFSFAAWPYPAQQNVTTYINTLAKNSDYQSYTGYINVTSHGSNIFYQLVTAKGSNPTDMDKPLLVWLQGGPGCSSLFGLYTEIGPYSIQADMNLTMNPYTYALDNHILFVEQPIGVGFSNINPADIAPNYTTQAALHFEQFLIGFFQVYPTLKNNDLYLIGESYAGHYIPSFASQIIQNQAVNQLPTLQGVIIGDGWTDPERQLNGYDSYAYSIGLVSNNRRNIYRDAQNSILQDIMSEEYVSASGLFDFITGTDPKFNESIPNVAGNVNVYNYRQYNYSGLDGPMAVWLNSSVVKYAFGVYPSDFNWLSCNDSMYYNFYGDISRSYKQNISYLLDHTRVLLYNGQNDIIVNTPSAENWIHSLEWSKSMDFLKTTKQNWFVNGTVVGTVKQLEPLTFAYVKGAGHMVPTDQPVNSLDMIRRWLNKDTNWSN